MSLKTIETAIGNIPAGIKLLENIVEDEALKLETWGYREALNGIVKLSFPLLGLLPLCARFPASLDLKAHNPLWPPVLDQGQLGSCVDNSVALCLAIVEAKETGTATLPSRLFLYGNARGWTADDSGSTIGACAKGAKEKGFPPESLWPYDPVEFTTKPPPPVWAAALKSRLTQSFWTLDEAAILHSLNAGYPVSFCTMLFKSFGDMSDAQGWVMPMPKVGEDLLGGHCMTIRGYDLGKRLFLVQNSWGLNWGLKGDLAGCFWAPFDIILSPTLCSGWRTFRSILNS